MLAEITSKLENMRDLPTLPIIARRMAQAVEDPQLNMEKLSRELSKDQSLTAKILRLVNSPFYGFCGKITNLSHAMVLLGTNVVKNAVLSVSILDSFPRQVKGFSAKGLWEHVIACAVAAHWLGALMGHRHNDDLFVAGLLHDIGKVFFLRAAPDKFLEAVELARRRGQPLIEAERAVMDCDHAEVGELMARQWRLPADLTAAVGCHHHPFRYQGEGNLPLLVHVADALVHQLQLGRSGADGVRVEAGVYEALGLSRSVVEEGAAAIMANFNQAKAAFAEGGRAG